MKTRTLVSIIAALGLHSVSASAAVGDNFKGLAVDAAGILYVANVSSADNPNGNVKAFDLQGNLVPEKSLNGTEMNKPTGVAFDSYGKLWVSQSGSSAVTHYAFANGAWWQDGDRPAMQNANIRSPQAIAVDGYDNVWLVNSDSSIPAFDFSGALLMSGQTPSHANAVAAKGPLLTLGQDAQSESLLALEVITNKIQNNVKFFNQTTAVAFDSAGNQYFGFGSGQLLRCPPRKAKNAFDNCRTLATPYGSYYPPAGMAVDLAHDRVYVSYVGIGASWVSVFNSKGVSIGTIN